ncbi:shufflon system plasmid conjugative transfer pilus tip adhesin PilV [Achromobacter insuavis]|uniref:shufflon system plasmid conjugative transfer pilus tip adhesin PilV n=1 Tax=Achromobacter insuavis TaxID=1287735 RepID=UPI001F142A28|nr:shufflon system plasmid conjugative transfer pilus tip adhesin PilV [Achromobacter insuavis]
MIMNAKCKTTLWRQAGNALIAYMLAMALAAGSIAGLQAYHVSTQHEREDSAAATYDRTVRNAVSRYVRENRQAILAAAAAGPVQITIPMLRNTEFLPASWSDKNIFGNVYRAVSYQRVAGGKTFLHTLVVPSGGQSINDMRLRNIVAKFPDGAGYVSADTPTVAKGANGMWSFSLTDYGLPAGGGRLLSALFFDEAGVAVDYLYRNAVPGRPELNRMNTALDMGGNDINNARDVRANQDVAAGRNINATGSIDARGWVTAGSALRIHQDGAWSGGWSMADNTWIRSIGDKNVYTGGEVQAGRVTATGRLRTTEYLQLDGMAYEGNGCSGNVVGISPAGLVLSCQYGVWRNQGKSKLQRYTWFAIPPGSWVKDYGDICQAQLDSWGWTASGWVATGSDACSEDGEECTSDGVRCFAVTLG